MFYVYMSELVKAQTHERIEDPLHILETKRQIDARQYVEKQLRKPLTKIFEMLMKARPDGKSSHNYGNSGVHSSSARSAGSALRGSALAHERQFRDGRIEFTQNDEYLHKKRQRYEASATPTPTRMQTQAQAQAEAHRFSSCTVPTLFVARPEDQDQDIVGHVPHSSLMTPKNTCEECQRLFMPKRKKQPLCNWCELRRQELLKEVNTLFEGEHTRQRKFHANKQNGCSFGILKFAVRNKTCVGCRCLLDRKDQKGLCKRCEPKREDILREKKAEFDEMDMESKRMHDICEKCQGGTKYEDIECLNIDCVDQFFKRREVDEERSKRKVQIDDLQQE